MKVLYKSAGGKFTVEFEGDSQKSIFKDLSTFQEIFETNNKHEGNCGGDTLFNVRSVDGNDFFEKKCMKCGMTYSYGQHKVGGGLFPNTKKGWTRWTPGQVDEEESPVAPFAGKSNGAAKGKGR
jgi:hypothetical protein